MKRSSVILIALLSVLLTGSFFNAGAQTMNEYCQVPPFLSTAVQPNIFFDIDVSGSMNYYGYSYGDSDNNGDGILDHYDPTKTYEGYFTPSKKYNLNASDVYEESTGLTCSCSCANWRCRNYDAGGCVPNGGGCKKWGCCTREECTGDCNPQSGNYLNYKNMTRIDLVRWAMTGGKPSTCYDSQTFNSGQCDPELWNQSGNDVKIGTVCNDSLDVNGDGVAEGGCILRTSNAFLPDGNPVQVKVPWDRINAGLVFKFKDLLLRPRIGAMFFSDVGVRAQQVYIGDFTSPNSTDDNFPFMNLITHINSATPSGSTPTGPAMWDALNYYAQKSPWYGGLSPQSGTGDHWKNPMYTCAQGGANCLYIPCANNFVILMSDGQWNEGGGPPALSTCTIDTGFESHSADPVVPGYKMHMPFQNVVTGINTSVTAVYTLGVFLSGTGAQAMKNVAMYGSFDNKAKTYPSNLSGYPVATCTMDDCGSGKGSACTPLPPSSSDWDKDGDGLPDTFYHADDALGIRTAIVDAVLDILRRTSSGTAVSILASGEGSGANLLQAFFYPKKEYGDSELSWVGEMQNLWYYLDPKLQSNTVREDTVTDKQLNLAQDDIIHFRFDSGLNKTRADRFDYNGNFVNTVDLENVHNLWEAGKVLWLRDPVSTYPRDMKTTLDGTSLVNFTSLDPANATVQNYLQASDATEATDIINYVHGTDIAGYRSRTAVISSVDGTPRVWKLGDIINSTPKIQSWVQLNTYDRPPVAGYSDSSYSQFISSADYKARGMVYVGGNDGMLHAFNLGLLNEVNDPANQNLKASLSGADLGKEQWAYIPKNVLPYLKYLADPNYCHLYYVDAAPYLVDASIAPPSDCTESDYWKCIRKTTVDNHNNLDINKTSWRTIIIGGMGTGGACKNSTVTCGSGNSFDLNGDGKVDNGDCVITPINGLGYSSYFALDITNPLSPSLLWEFSNPSLGFSTTGPVIVRTGDKNKNGRWFAIFASGPTGPIDPASQQFYGNSDQNLRLFILDLKNGALLRTITMDGTNGTPSIPRAFGGSMFNTIIDTDRWNPGLQGNYQDDVFYSGYVKRDVSAGTWTNGGILRIMTKESTDPDDWVVSTLIDNIGPMTTSIGHLQDRSNHKLWLYFGTGRYFYKIGTNIDDADSQRTIYGVKEPCYTGDDKFDPSCTAQVAGLTVATDTEPASGWYIPLDPSDTSYKAERVITNPLAAFTGGVFFTTYAPTGDICGFGGNTYLWMVGYDTGWTARASAKYGTALVQVSTGEIKELPLSSVFTERGGRRTTGFPGVPPKGQGLTVVVKPKPIQKIIHTQEK